MTRREAAAIAQAAGRCCEYCAARADYSHDSFSIDHIIPLALGGTDAPENLCHACQGCNGHKGSAVAEVDPATGERVSLYNPRAQEWTRHFAWSIDNVEVIGLTAVGRATVARLRLNRPALVSYRRVLARWGLHPHPRFRPAGPPGPGGAVPPGAGE